MIGLIAWQATASTVQQTPPQPPSPAAGQSREESLWAAIQALTREAPVTDGFRDHLAKARRRNEALLARIRGYLSVYPGGSHRDDAFRLELATLFDIGTLRGGDYDELRSRVGEYLRNPPCVAARDEAAYWAITCDRLAAADRSPPTSAPVAGDDQSLDDATRAFADHYPRNRLTPHVLSWAFDAAERRQDRDGMREIVARLTAEAPQHAVTKLLTARLRRADAVGAQFAISFDDTTGRRIDTREYAGNPLLVVVWSGANPDAAECVADIENTRRSSRDLRVVGVNLDSSVAEMSAACGALGVTWPQLHDGRGRAGEFVVEWGIRSVPYVFVIGRDGRLIGSADGAGWRPLLRSALDN